MTLRGNYHGNFLLFPSASISRLRSTAGFWFHSPVFYLQLIQAALMGLGGVFEGIETLFLGQDPLL